MSRRVTRRGVLPAESEAAFQQKIVNLARFNGWRVYHPPDNRPSGRTGRVQDVVAGFPDLTLVRGTVLVFAELKAKAGRISPAQQEWLDALAETGTPTYLWKAGNEDDWRQIQQVLSRPVRSTP